MSRPSLIAAGSALWHALQCWAKTHANRRDLRDGTQYRIDVRVTGTAGGYDVDETIAGRLSVSESQTTASNSAVPTAHLVAWLWAQVPATRRADLQAEAVAYFAEHAELPGVDEQMEGAAKLWMKQLRATKQTVKEGAVSFEPDADPEHLEAAEARAA